MRARASRSERRAEAVAGAHRASHSTRDEFRNPPEDARIVSRRRRAAEDDCPSAPPQETDSRAPSARTWRGDLVCVCDLEGGLRHEEEPEERDEEETAQQHAQRGHLRPPGGRAPREPAAALLVSPVLPTPPQPTNAHPHSASHSIPPTAAQRKPSTLPAIYGWAGGGRRTR